MDLKRKIGVEDAYGLNTPEDSVRLYADWAETYDADFVSQHGYVYHLEIARLFLEYHGVSSGPVLDVGCGTGVVGVALREAGITGIDGIDISAAMLAQSGTKTAGDGQPVYRNLIEADLTKTLDIPDGRYQAIVSAGTFTHGHLGPQALDELWRVAAPGATCVIGINATHYEKSGFAGKLAADVAGGKITEPTLDSVDMYAGRPVDDAHAGDQALVAVCRTI